MKDSDKKPSNSPKIERFPDTATATANTFFPLEDNNNPNTRIIGNQDTHKNVSFNPSRSRSPFKLDVKEDHDITGFLDYDPGSSEDLRRLIEDLPVSGSVPHNNFEIIPTSNNNIDNNNSKSTTLMAVFNFTNSIIGAGIMGLPYAMNKAGLGVGIILLIAMTVIVDWSVILLVQNGKLSSTSTYQDMVHRTFGFPGYLLITIFQFLFAYGGMAAYMVIVADNMPKVIGQLFGSESILANRSFLLTLLTVFVMYPLSCFRNVTKLASTSMVSLVAVLLLVLVVAIEAPLHAKPETMTSSVDFGHKDVFQAVGVIAFAFVCHHNSFIIFESLRRPSLNRFSAVTHYSTGISLVASLCMAIPGYLAFRQETQANILENLPSDSPIINFARFCFAFTMFLTYPMECFVAREVIQVFFFPNQHLSAVSHYLITTILVAITYVIALSTNNLGFILELTGGFSATLLACYIKLSGGGIFDKKKWTSWIVISFGVFTMILSTYFTIHDAFF